jgi:hypothetical protein
MSKLPDPKVLAVLVSNVTRTMCDTIFVPGDPSARGESICTQMVMIPLRGDPEIVVVVSSDTRGGRALATAFFGGMPRDITQDMIDDAIAELLNMVAAQISTALQLNHTLGFPRRTTLAEISEGGRLHFADAVLLRSEGKVDLGLWILETESIKEHDPKSCERSSNVFQTLLRLIVPIPSDPRMQ